VANELFSNNGFTYTNGYLFVTSDSQGKGIVYVYNYSAITNSWNLFQNLTTNNPQGVNFGASVASYGNTALIGDNNANSTNGVAYIFVFNGALWIQQSMIKPVVVSGITGSLFGTTCALYNNTALIGALGDNNYAGSVYVFKFISNIYTFTQVLLPYNSHSSGYFGLYAAISNNLVVVGYPSDNVAGANSGSIYTYYYDGTSSWVPFANVSGALGYTLGHGLSIYNNYIIAGAYFGKGIANNTGISYFYSENVIDNGGYYPTIAQNSGTQSIVASIPNNSTGKLSRDVITGIIAGSVGGTAAIVGSASLLYLFAVRGLCCCAVCKREKKTCNFG